MTPKHMSGTKKIGQGVLEMSPHTTPQMEVHGKSNRTPWEQTQQSNTGHRPREQTHICCSRGRCWMDLWNKWRWEEFLIHCLVWNLLLLCYLMLRSIKRTVDEIFFADQ